MTRTTRQLRTTLLSVVLLLNLAPAPYAAQDFASDRFDIPTHASRTQRRQPDRAAHKRPKRVAQVRVAKATYPVIVSWEHDGGGARGGSREEAARWTAADASGLTRAAGRRRGGG